MIRPPKMACSLALCTFPLHQCLLHVHPTHVTDLATYLSLNGLVSVVTFKSEHLLRDSLAKG